MFVFLLQNERVLLSKDRKCVTWMNRGGSDCDRIMSSSYCYMTFTFPFKFFRAWRRDRSQTVCSLFVVNLQWKSTTHPLLNTFHNCDCKRKVWGLFWSQTQKAHIYKGTVIQAVAMKHKHWLVAGSGKQTNILLQTLLNFQKMTKKG